MHNYQTIYRDLFTFLSDNKLDHWRELLVEQLRYRFDETPHGDLERWLNALNALPDLHVDSIHLNQNRVGVSRNAALSEYEHAQLLASLKGLMPWRKGPFELLGVHIETEWRSDWKWDRISQHLSPLKNRMVLDVGCGSGYHCWRMLGEGARRVIGIDPSNLFLLQFQAIKKYCGPVAPIDLLPIKAEELAPDLECFDTTFSMGVLYHRRSPIDHLYELKDTLRPGGELVLETLVVDGPEGYSLVPEDRYAMMRNVWFLPSIPTMEQWLKRVGFKDVRCVENNFTSAEEQHSTEWMQFKSLPDFLDPNDPTRTIEGYPAPRRATFIAQK
jgi:tRNA (mo5U34)-methyltransferase